MSCALPRGVHRGNRAVALIQSLAGIPNVAASGLAHEASVMLISRRRLILRDCLVSGEKVLRRRYLRQDRPSAIRAAMADGPASPMWIPKEHHHGAARSGPAPPRGRRGSTAMEQKQAASPCLSACPHGAPTRPTPLPPFKKAPNWRTSRRANVVGVSRRRVTPTSSPKPALCWFQEEA